MRWTDPVRVPSRMAMFSAMQWGRFLGTYQSHIARALAAFADAARETRLP